MRALISVSDKQGITEFAQGLAALHIDIISTGGTADVLRKAGIPVRDVADVTQFPELMEGRLKTLHPNIHGGILGRRDSHADIARKHGIDWIDLVIVNLYPFAQIIQKPNVTDAEAIENIDIGGPTMIRAAAKNNEWVAVVVDPADYTLVLNALRENNQVSAALRRELAVKAFAYTAEYDARIYRYLSATNEDSIHLSLKKSINLRYGENPHQPAEAYQFTEQHTGILSARQHQGKPLSYNNITDADAAVACVREFTQPACVIVKHANPCGAAIADNLYAAWQHALNADKLSAFGGIVALNQRCTEEIAVDIAEIFVEVLIAPSYTAAALQILANKPNLRVLELDLHSKQYATREFKFIEGGVLIQEKDTTTLQAHHLKIVTTQQPTAEQMATMLFAWPVLKHIKSNAILIAKELTTVGIGAGQVSRVDAVDIALKKAGNLAQGSILASDAFFPFRDSIDRLRGTGITAIIQPGGSIRDEEVIAACNEQHIAMVFTHLRCFKH